MSFKENLLNKSNSYTFYKERYEELSEKYDDSLKKIDELNNEIALLKKEKNQLMDNFAGISESIANLKVDVDDDLSRTKEINYAFIFNDTISESEWLKKRNFSLNNSASNYSFMYTLFRILDEVNPKNILELGLGQTSKMTSQYANHFPDSKLTIVDGDQVWIDVFSEKFEISENIDILQCDTEMFDYNGTENLRFANLEDIVGDNKFDLIIIDGPQGFIFNPKYHLFDYSRSNIWNLLDNLADEFVIIIDDYNRQGEKNTMSRLQELLNERNISVYHFQSSGIKDQHVICTEEYRFISWF
jgi:hypothetical protein